jgi:predicted phosphodiesterase
VFLPLLAAAVAPAAAPTTQPVDLLAGASWKWKLERPGTQPTTGPAAGAFRLVGQVEFDVASPRRYASLELAHGLNPLYQMRFSLNGHAIRAPLEGMLYRVIPGIDAGWLAEGRNVLAADVSGPDAQRTAKSAPAAATPVKDSLARLEAEGPKMKLLALRPEDLKVIMGPVLFAGGDVSVVTCRANMPAKVTLLAMDFVSGSVKGSISARSTGDVKTDTTSETPGMILRTPVSMPPPQYETLSYQLEVRTPDGAGSVKLGPWTCKALPKDGKLRFVALGDNRSNPEGWSKVAAAALKAKPDLVVHTGDLVSQGRADWLWEDQFFTPAKDLLATVPFYPVIGNHEGDAPLYYELFYTPSPDGRGRNWQQTIGAVQLIGIDGSADWSGGGQNAKWLEGVLAGSQAKFVFLVTHYPAWSSSRHGRMEEEGGQAAERKVRAARQVILPLLAKYRATAMIAGHDHNYQRSEPPEGVTVIVTGGAGAPLYQESEDAAGQNPYSKAFAAVLHYCLFAIDGDACTMQALTPEGKVLDERSWNARRISTTGTASLTTNSVSK